jgi:hypothetical protein
MQYQVRFARYANGESRIGGTTFIYADDFTKAVTLGNAICGGMHDADPNREYRVIAITERDVRGIDCEGGCNMFETAEEFTARVAAKEAK